MVGVQVIGFGPGAAKYLTNRKGRLIVVNPKVTAMADYQNVELFRADMNTRASNTFKSVTDVFPEIKILGQARLYALTNVPPKFEDCFNGNIQLSSGPNFMIL